MLFKHKLLALLTLPALAGAGLVAGAGVSVAAPSSAAADPYYFRMSNFGGFVADICVVTDADRVCTGAWATGKSEVFPVRANFRDGWYCSASIALGDNTFSDQFSRNEFKECAIHGITTNTWWELKRP